MGNPAGKGVRSPVKMTSRSAVRLTLYGGRYFLCLRTGFPYNTASINPHTREGETEC
jgi:hypothetical protein